MFHIKGKNYFNVRRAVSISGIYSVGEKVTILSKPDSLFRRQKDAGGAQSHILRGRLG